MAIHTLVDVSPKLPAFISVLLRGPHGIGKSQLARQVARIIAHAEQIKDFEFIDQRLSQKTEGDLIGLPSTDGEVTRFNPPDWYKRACVRPCFLLLDELNRATQEVMQAAFQIVLDRELNGWKLHPQTRVWSAINSSQEYTVNEMDPALLDRFWVVDLKPDVKDWLAWAKGEGDIHPTLIDFHAANGEKWLDPPKGAEAGSVHSSRRSWERMDRSHKHAGVADDPSNPLFYHIAVGFVGVEAAIAFHDFAVTVDTRVSGKDVIDGYDKVQHKVKKFTADRINDLVDKVSDHVTKNLNSLTEKQGTNLKQFLKDLPGEQRVNCWSKLTLPGTDKMELARSIHKYCAAAVLDVFGVPMGEAGIGIVPDIPGIFKSPGAGGKKK
jgi:energy-coupling factor transporter ATP-binding protein EcfA2